MTPAEIRAALCTLGLSQVEAARMLGYGAQSRISEIENGSKKPNRSVIRLLQLYLRLHEQAPHLLPNDWPR